MSSWTQRNLPPQASVRLANVKKVPSVAQLVLVTTAGVALASSNHISHCLFTKSNFGTGSALKTTLFLPKDLYGTWATVESLALATEMDKVTLIKILL
jgi:hypothetical protein